MDLISIIIPAYQAARHITQTLESALSQTYAPIEIIVVDDGSPDHTEAVVRSSASITHDRVRYLRTSNGGVASARNTGFAHSRGSAVLFLDHDDLIRPDHLSNLKQALDASPECGVAYSAAYYLDEAGETNLGELRVPLQGHLLVALVMRKAALPSPGVGLVRRDVVTRVGGFDRRFSTLADLDFWIRIARAGHAFAYVDAPSFGYRIRPDSMSSEVHKQELEDFALLERVFAEQPISDELLQLRSDAYAIAYYDNAARYYRVGDIDRGRDRLRQAIDASAHLANDGSGLLDWVAFNAMSPRTANPGGFMDTVFAHLPPNARMLRQLQTTAYGNYHIQSAFQAYRQHRYQEVIPHLWPGMRGNPGILRNKGFLSLSIKSLLRRV